MSIGASADAKRDTESQSTAILSRTLDTVGGVVSIRVMTTTNPGETMTTAINGKRYLARPMNVKTTDGHALFHVQPFSKDGSRLLRRWTRGVMAADGSIVILGRWVSM